MSLLKNALVVLLISICVSFLTDYALRKEFIVHTSGAIVISGTSSGIGKHVTFELAKLGYVVFAGVRKSQDLQILSDEAEKQNLKKHVIPIIMDVTNQATIDDSHKTVSAFLEKSKLPLVGVVNNAGIGAQSPFESVPIKRVKEVFETNFFGAISLTQKYLPLIREKKGRVIFVSSLAGFMAMPGATAYAGTKHALEAAADSLRLEMENFGVSVSVVQPGYINTSVGMNSMWESELVSDEQKKLYQKFWEVERELVLDSVINGGQPAETSAVIIHALTDKFPRTRYPVGAANGFPAGFLAFTASVFPDRLVDIMKNLSSLLVLVKK